ncbi:MAG: sulfite exporter TauE/SafE family protein [Hyphomicrobiaceae bacterium]
MNLYLPIAEMSVNVFTFLGLGAAVGFLAGMFGVGGGFLITPLLIFLGVPATVAVGTGAAQTVAASVSGALAQWQRRNVDVKLGLVLLAGGLVGSVIGVQFVSVLRRAGQFEFVVSLLYVAFLGIVGALMMVESIRSLRVVRHGGTALPRRSGQHTWMDGLPFKMRFKTSRLYISAIPPVTIGFLVGILAAIMGVGGGFIMIPAMIYLLRVPTSVVVGTSLFQIVLVTAVTTLLHAYTNFAVDVMLALILIVGSVLGAQFGSIAGERLRGEQLRFLLAALVLAVGLRVAYGLIVEPDELYSITRLQSGGG